VLVMLSRQTCLDLDIIVLDLHTLFTHGTPKVLFLAMLLLL